MTEMTYRDQTTIYLPVDDSNLTKVKTFLSYKDESIAYLIKQTQKNGYKWRQDPQKTALKITELKEQLTKSLLYMDDKGYYTLKGLVCDLEKQFNWAKPSFTKSDFKRIPLKHKPFDMRPYQKDALNALLKYEHASIEIPTGGGKSLIILNLLINQPVKTLIMAPLSEVADQLYKQLLQTFGPQYVGKYSSTSKSKTKLFTVATTQALTRIDQDHPAWDLLSDAEQIIFDESHSCPAATFQSICLEGVGAKATYRYFVSATQMRSDGKDLLLGGIIGPTVYRTFMQDLVSQGYLKSIQAAFLRVPGVSSASSEPKEETRRNLYENPHVYKMVSDMVSKIYAQTDLQVLILIEEYSQFVLLKNYLTNPFEFAHGTISSDAKNTVPQEYWKCDLAAIVEKFNRLQTRVLIGTSAVSTGVDIQPTGVIFYIQGGKSEIKVKQSIGRGTRPVGPKVLKVFDFIVSGSPTLERHAAYRKEIYESITEIPVKVY